MSTLFKCTLRTYFRLLSVWGVGGCLVFFFFFCCWCAVFSHKITLGHSFTMIYFKSLETVKYPVWCTGANLCLGHTSRCSPDSTFMILHVFSPVILCFLSSGELLQVPGLPPLNALCVLNTHHQQHHRHHPGPLTLSRPLFSDHAP